WELWFRVSLAGAVAGTHVPLAISRVHGGQDSRVRGGDGVFALDYYLGMHMNKERLQRAGRANSLGDVRVLAAEKAQAEAWAQDRIGCFAGRVTYARLAWQFAPSRRTLGFLMRSWLKLRLRGHGTVDRYGL